MQSPLRNLRKSQGMTLSHVATAVDIDPGNLSRIERGQQIASTDVAEKLVNFFSGQINELQILYPQRYLKPTESQPEGIPQKKRGGRG
ncbi:TPA: helix-turn-helix transcriptional regulator [Klebsiella aerogenes]|uniref:helix-turn-helix domain-containing protein n=1 Tax=Klebsiella pneumoniae TaxID=573 RepID=UPI0007D6CD05|nr:helix-turn-helix transcriptional regulator [Klebsiella pneumoniae]HBT2486651.1 helix-turn-helix transcriptional regulator [Klebsiella aerogenes]HBT2497506.1 helix-turn-helix transcriptional regulator [Klebsiella aerogenes]HBT6206096.1 helix-turn-helix transcriptional regulator [Klebsiella pneumoniae]